MMASTAAGDCSGRDMSYVETIHNFFCHDHRACDFFHNHGTLWKTVYWPHSKKPCQLWEDQETWFCTSLTGTRETKNCSFRCVGNLACEAESTRCTLRHFFIQLAQLYLLQQEENAIFML
ncbi:uncharacterized protein LOC134770390 [Penaeus indicus]|uniref:uncharacterized protein LOC134770390 n=1 Tax=Penaeus indicus TaxID=29960 RepID=UPI00300BFB9A